MVYASFAKWYVTRLKAQPLLVNLSSGFVLMSTGDVLAQRVEVRKVETKQQHHGQQESIAPVEELPVSSASSPGSLFLQATDAAYRAIQDEITSFGWDKSRTAKMAAWSVIFTPFYVGIFKLYDRYLPKKNLPSIAARVGCSFLSSIPINFAFYSYGTFVEHTMEWYEERKTQRALQIERLTNGGNQLPLDNAIDVPYRFDDLVKKTERKLEAEFMTTIKTSAKFWIPLNFLSFSIVPTHIQPLNLMFWNVFWNCYLSLSQHREVVLDDETKNDEATPA